MNTINVCPVCGSRKVTVPKRKGMGCAWLTFLFISMGLGAIFYFLTPKYSECTECGAIWKV